MASSPRGRGPSPSASVLRLSASGSRLTGRARHRSSGMASLVQPYAESRHTDHVPWCKCKAQGLSTERMATALHIWCDAAALRGHPHPAQHQCSVRIMARIGVRQDIRKKGASSGNSKQQQHQRYQDTRRDREKQQRKTTTRPGHERPRRPTLEDDQQQQEKQACRFWC
ncbi:hypothetical protein BBK36DRAFT_1193955 [Trichoderma citrinoviride]|uniref:Uncharacterized protein n=1 Tax=Trichoderma citrinoviride TaxID=58853 RepID=A0A2T4BF60_9HYPO|nr:hypothetical protein BBK36DRAFT_1193955 [Trichoderma citrinoviride]PTB67839.1 hypothetical protein BBK36DRAFT_1193955 [Trichoderma citrinoviride]